MKKPLTHIFISLITALFVNFMFANVVFTHVHYGADGRPVTHSHPYLPNAAHGHTAQSLDLVSAFNAGALSASASPAPVLTEPSADYITLAEGYIQPGFSRHTDAASLRGPPVNI